MKNSIEKALLAYSGTPVWVRSIILVQCLFPLVLNVALAKFVMLNLSERTYVDHAISAIPPINGKLSPAVDHLVEYFRAYFASQHAMGIVEAILFGASIFAFIIWLLTIASFMPSANKPGKDE